MIGFLSGRVVAIAGDRLVLDVQGVGYVIEASGRTLARLETGAKAEMWIETRVAQDSIRLFGFPTDDERAWFEQLQTIPGVGPRAALSVLDVLTPAALMDAVALEDKAAIARANGVGPKLAARIAQELKGKAPPKGYFGHFAPIAPIAGAKDSGASVANPAAIMRADAVSALVNLGYAGPDAQRAVAAAIRMAGEDDVNVGALVKRALQELAAP